MEETAKAPQRFLDAHEITTAEVAEWFDVDSSTIYRKLSGSRRWTEPEIKTFLARAAARVGRTVTFEEVWGAPAIEAAK
jgi:hypothetical protein